MSYDRSSWLVKAGRKLQKGSFLLAPLDPLFQIGLPRTSCPAPAIILVAPPRSGSTLLYQTLTTGLDGFYLTNLWNFLYASPAIGAWLSKKLCHRRTSDFTSRHGFVPGGCGEAEGLKFWSYWSGQTQFEAPYNLLPQRARKIARLLEKIGSQRGQPFVAGFLGHAFCMELLRDSFSRPFFVHLTRDLLSNAYSLFRFSPENWSSTRPSGYEQLLHLPRHEQVLEHLFLTHRTILEHKGPDTLTVSYRELCDDPRFLVKKIAQAYKSRYDTSLSLKGMEQLPTNFEHHLISPEKDELSRQLQKTLQEKIDTSSGEQNLFRSIYRP